LMMKISEEIFSSTVPGQVPGQIRYSVSCLYI
jgi:hypothetical protein